MSRQYQGASEVNIPLGSILEGVEAWADEIVQAVGNELVKETRARAATAFTDRSGKLRKSIKKKKSRFDDRAVIVGASMPHAHLIEHGHMVVERGGKNKPPKATGQHVPAYPFLGPAAEAVKERLPQIVNNVVGAITVEVKK